MAKLAVDLLATASSACAVAMVTGGARCARFGTEGVGESAMGALVAFASLGLFGVGAILGSHQVEHFVEFVDLIFAWGTLRAKLCILLLVVAGLAGWGTLLGEQEFASFAFTAHGAAHARVRREAAHFARSLGLRCAVFAVGAVWERNKSKEEANENTPGIYCSPVSTDRGTHGVSGQAILVAVVLFQRRFLAKLASRTLGAGMR